MGAVKVLGQQPGSGLPVLLKRGPFGLYVQLVSGELWEGGWVEGGAVKF
jgi:topoisomerase IA-like protein